MEAPIDAQMRLLHYASSPGEGDPCDLLWRAESALFRLGAQVVGVPDTADIQAGCTAAGQAYGGARLLLGLPQAIAHGRVPLAKPQLEVAGLTEEALLSGLADTRIEELLRTHFSRIRSSLDVARQFLARLPRGARVAFLPLALVEPYLRALERSGRALLREETRFAPLTRVWRIAAGHWLGRL
jgi:phytoene synthase